MDIPNRPAAQNNSQSAMSASWRSPHPSTRQCVADWRKPWLASHQCHASGQHGHACIKPHLTGAHWRQLIAGAYLARYQSAPAFGPYRWFARLKANSGYGGFSGFWGHKCPNRRECAARHRTNHCPECEKSAPLTGSLVKADSVSFCKKREEIIAGRLRQLRNTDAFKLGQSGGRIGNKTWLIALTAMRHRRQKRRICLNQ